MRLSRAAVTLHRIPRKKALVEAGAWRKFLLRGLFSTMSEPRPWMHLRDRAPIRGQIASSKAIEPYRASLTELLETAEVARLLLPNDDIARQYHEWLYQNTRRRRPQPPPRLPKVPGAPKWAVMARETWRELEAMARWWIERRRVPNGELGGGVNDDTDLFQVWQCLHLIESEPLGAMLKDTAARVADLAWREKLEKHEYIAELALKLAAIKGRED